MSVILFNTKLSAATGKQCGLVTEVLGTKDQFEKELRSNVQRLLSVPLQVYLRDNFLIDNNILHFLHIYN